MAAETALLESRNYAQAVTEFMGEGLLTLDPEGRVTYVNRAAEALVGWTAAELRGRRIGELITGPPTDAGAPHFGQTPIGASLAGESTVRIEDALFRTGGGGALPIAYTSTPFRPTTA